MGPYRRDAYRRRLATLLAVLVLGMLWPGAPTELRGPLAGTLRILVGSSMPPVSVAGTPHVVGRTDRARPVDHRDEGRFGWLRAGGLEKATQARGRQDRGPGPLTAAVLAGLAAVATMLTSTRRDRRRRMLRPRAVAGNPSRGPPLLGT